MNFATRFAPSPTGPLHLGHAFSAMLAHDMARAAGGTFHLRIEDIDTRRSKPEWEAALRDDLSWLGLRWPEPAMRQSGRLPAHRAALDRLAAMGLTYPCTCSRRDIREAATAPQEGTPLQGPDGLVYPGTCKHADRDPEGAAIRLHMDRALELAGPIAFEETGDGPAHTVHAGREHMLARIGDVVLARREMGTSYHLAVALDDAAQGITHVTRGRDLATATAIHVLIQRILGLPTPIYHHHRLIHDETGRRLAKRDAARAIRAYREEGATPGDLRRLTGLAARTP